MCRFEICHYSYWAPYSEQTTATRINSGFITYFNQVNNAMIYDGIKRYRLTQCMSSYVGVELIEHTLDDRISLGTLLDQGHVIIYCWNMSQGKRNCL